MYNTFKHEFHSIFCLPGMYLFHQVPTIFFIFQKYLSNTLLAAANDSKISCLYYINHLISFDLKKHLFLILIPYILILQANYSDSDRRTYKCTYGSFTCATKNVIVKDWPNADKDYVFAGCKIKCDEAWKSMSDKQKQR